MRITRRAKDERLTLLLNRPCHYPTAEVAVQLKRRAFGDEAVDLNYDVLSLDPGYRVVGSHTRMWGPYEDG